MNQKPEAKSPKVKILRWLVLFVGCAMVPMLSPLACDVIRQCLQNEDCPPGYRCGLGQCVTFSGTDASTPEIKSPTCPTSCVGNKDCQKEGCLGKPRCEESRCVQTKWLYPIPSGQVDILFVIDNSGSMAPKLKLLEDNIEILVNDLNRVGLQDFQVGAISTDMSNQAQSGRLLGNPRIVNFKKMGEQGLPALKNLLQQSPKGGSYEKGLDAIREALILAQKEFSLNTGMLRQHSLLAILIATDEDDCSNTGIPESELDSAVCYFPKSVILKDLNGDPLLDSKGQPVRGQMEKLTPVQTYVDFLKKLKRSVVISGLMGDPELTKESGGTYGKCSDDAECRGEKKQTVCGFTNTTEKLCGGCGFSPDSTARPGFRYAQLLKSFGNVSSWVSICDKRDEFRSGLEQFANQIIQMSHALPLDAQLEELPRTIVELIAGDGTKVIPQATQTQNKCSLDKNCRDKTLLCGPSGYCMKNGWIYYPPATSSAKPRLRFAGQNMKDWPTNATISVRILEK